MGELLIREVLTSMPNGVLEQLIWLESQEQMEPDPLDWLNKMGETCEWKKSARGT